MSTTEDSIAEIYAPPKAKLEKRGYYVEGEFIVGRNPISLPDRCVRSNGQRAGGRLSRTFKDTNLWRFRFTPLQKCQITYSLSAEWHARLNRRRLLVNFGVAAGIVIFALGFQFGVLLSFVGIVAAVVAVSIGERSSLPLRVAKEKGGQFYLRGGCKEFLDSVAAERPLK